MGVYFDYFRAAGEDEARATHELLGGPLSAQADGADLFDGVGTKGIFPDPHLEQLVARVRATPYERGPQTSWRLWPPPDTPPPADETSLWLTDPGVERLATRIRDVLAGVEEGDIGDLGAAWAVDLIDFSDDEATGVLAELAALARRAQASGQELYCWSSL